MATNKELGIGIYSRENTIRTKKFKALLQTCYDSGWNKLGKPSTTQDNFLKLFTMIPHYEGILNGYQTGYFPKEHKEDLLEILVTVLSLLNSHDEDSLRLNLYSESLSYLVDKTKKPKKKDLEKEYGSLDECFHEMYVCLSRAVDFTLYSTAISKDFANLDCIVRDILWSCAYVGYDLLDDFFSMIVVPELKVEIESPKFVIGSRYYFNHHSWLEKSMWYELIGVQGDFATLAEVKKTKLSKNHIVVSIHTLNKLTPVYRQTDTWFNTFPLTGKLLSI